MKRSTLFAAAAGAVLVLGVTGTALAAADDSGSVTVSASPSPGATDDDFTASPSPSATDDDGGLRGDGSVDDDGSPGEDGPRSGATSSPSTAAPTTGKITAAQAGQIARNAAGGGRIVRIEAGWEHGRAVWDVRVMNGSVRHDIDVDRATGAINRHKSDDKGDDD